MRVFITGGLGFVGTQVSERLLQKGHEVTVVDHSPEPMPYTPETIKYVSADTTASGAWQKEIVNHDAVINLAGASIFQRWNDTTKQLIYNSRILTTHNVVEAMSEGSASLLCNTSAVGYYGFQYDEEMIEEDRPGDDFLATVCVDWENEALKAADKGIRVIITRFGIVLGKTGGALGRMISTFKKFVGGPLGSGNQWFSWIHMDDLLNALLFVFDNQDISGPVNICSPNPVRNRELATALGKALSRPSFFKAPDFLIRLMLGEFGSVILEGQRVIPAKLLRQGFTFQYPEITAALEEVIRG
jgi:uncharacterized protein (TIGR01777 family)